MSITVHVSHGPDKYAIPIDNPDYTTVEELKILLHEKTGVPPESQKLIFSGRTLKHDQLLGEVGMKDKSKLMLLGRKTDPKQDEWIKKLEQIEADVGSIENKITKLQNEVTDIEKGFLPEELVEESYKKLSKQCLICNETLMKKLEALDSVIPAASETLVRGKRRTIVTKIQSLMSLTDSIQNKIMMSSDAKTK